jgi:hypothetical protein
MLSVTYNPLKLSVIMLNVSMLSNVPPLALASLVDSSQNRLNPVLYHVTQGIIKQVASFKLSLLLKNYLQDTQTSQLN